MKEKIKSTEERKNKIKSKRFLIKILIIVAFAVAMAYLESVLVVYLREILSISYPSQMPSAAETALKIPYFALLKNPLVVIPNVKLLWIEIFREAATMVMLFSFAWLVGKKWRDRLAIFLMSFAVWDIFYYVFLYVLLGWPASLATLDVLFLIPLPWVAPVWVPLAASTAMIFIAFELFKHSELDVKVEEELERARILIQVLEKRHKERLKRRKK